MAERVKWWKAFLPKKKPGGPKDQASPHTYGADFDPFAQNDKPKDPKAATEPSPPQQESTNGSCLLSDETYDDSHLESLFNEQTCRRNMKVSRSGRFKEKRRVRSSLPLEDKGTENMAPATEDFR
uniref:proline-rich protein 15-like protein n=1 Tax=Doryrhamphus excisus TaxID=161450 RepID=UPI0025AEB083|nr:proline-rich protein 15-like protein [Doryrhamphus excisus]XP_057903838.1 proline-rich protein 15-like protein [Doryrhamphus excisus]XP_057903839.1 proline-rich protein 15-like protein [Doryrhamphus excisus]